MSRNLAAFDFDHTIVNGNSDIIVRQLLPSDEVPKYQNERWTSYMQSLFNLLYRNKINESQVNEIVNTLPPICGMIELIRELSTNYNYDIIIISDSNLHFINSWLKHNNLSNCIAKIFTNPAEFKNGLLKIEMYEVQESCKLCAKNMCKGRILTDFVNDQKRKGVIYDKVMYSGDGSNDFCPILSLRANDLACCRTGFKVAQLALDAQSGKKYRDECHEVRAKVLMWSDGIEILNAIKVNS